MGYSNKNLKTEDNSNLSSSKESVELKNANNIGDIKDLNTENNNKGKRMKSYRKINDSHLICIRKCLKEDKLIGPTEAMRKLQEETGLIVAVTTVRKILADLRKEMGPEYDSLDPSLIKNRQLSNRTKLKDTHIECLKRYLKEDICIGNTEARNRLKEETGLNLSITTIRQALVSLESETRPGDSKLSSSESTSTTVRAPWIYGKKLNDIHIEYLKKYLIEDSSIGCTKARKKLKEDTELEVSIHTMRKALLALKQEINQEAIESPLPGLEAKVRCRSKAYGFKIKDSHLECLKKYLNENNSIGPTYARDRLYKETGLEVSVPAIQSTLIELREQNNLVKDHTNLNNSNSDAGSKSWVYGRKLKDIHIKCLKKYLNEDSSIGSTIAKNRLYEETGLEISTYPVQKALIRLKKEIDVEKNDIASATSKFNINNKNRDLDYSLKDLHLKCIEKYLKEDKYIGYKRARDLLKEETGFYSSVTTIRKVMINLRKELGHEYTNIDHTELKSRNATCNSKLMDLHFELLSSYMKKDNSIRPAKANRRLKEDTGLQVHNSTVWKALKKLKKEKN